MDLCSPGEAELREIITSPASAAEITYELKELPNGQSIALSDQILLDTGNADALPLLQQALQSLYEDADKSDCEKNNKSVSIRWEDYEKIGGVQGAIATQADKVITQLDQEVQNQLPVLISEFVRRFREDGSVELQTVSIQNLSDSPEKIKLLDSFIKNRLLIKEGDSEDQRIRVVHEALFRQWKTAQTILELQKEFIDVRERIMPIFMDYQLAKKQKKRLKNSWLHDPLLARATTLLKNTKLRWLPGIVEFITRSKRIRRRRRNISYFVISIVGAIGFLMLLAIGENANMAKKAAKKSLKSESKLLEQLAYIKAEDGDYLGAVDTALSGLPGPSNNDRPFVPSTYGAMLYALAMQNVNTYIKSNQNWRVSHPINLATYSRDGKYIAAFDNYNNIVVWERETANVVIKHELLKKIFSLSFSPDSRFLMYSIVGDVNVFFIPLEGKEYSAIKFTELDRINKKYLNELYKIVDIDKSGRFFRFSGLRNKASYLYNGQQF